MRRRLNRKVVRRKLYRTARRKRAARQHVLLNELSVYAQLISVLVRRSSLAEATQGFGVARELCVESPVDQLTFATTKTTFASCPEPPPHFSIVPLPAMARQRRFRLMSPNHAPIYEE
jgi:hypothetical protein